MDKQQQKEFVETLTESIKLAIINNIEQGKIPDNWDGIELRQYIKDYAAGCCMGDFKGKRKRDYNNTLIVNNL